MRNISHLFSNAAQRLVEKGLGVGVKLLVVSTAIQFGIRLHQQRCKMSGELGQEIVWESWLACLLLGLQLNSKQKILYLHLEHLFALIYGNNFSVQNRVHVHAE